MCDYGIFAQSGEVRKAKVTEFSDVKTQVGYYAKSEKIRLAYNNVKIKAKFTFYKKLWIVVCLYEINKRKRGDVYSGT